MQSSEECACLDPEQRSEWERRSVGVDETKGRFGEVSLERCARCRRVWLCYFVEYEGFSRSGRWFRAVVSEEEAARVRPETAAELLASKPWHIYGGSYFGHAGKRGVGGEGSVRVDS